VKLNCREILESDIESLASLLTRGFVRRKREYWTRGLCYQGKRSVPPGVPRYGYLLEYQGLPVGCLLLIYSSKIVGGESSLFCNLSSWYVDPLFRNYASLLASMAQKRDDVTYFNLTPDVSTWPIIEAQGFMPYCRGVYISGPFLTIGGRGMRVEAVTPDTQFIEGLTDTENEVVKRHAEYGCLTLLCHTPEGPLPFVFLSLPKRWGLIPVPAVYLGYCRCVGEYVRCAGSIGRYLSLRGKPVVVLDANGPVAGLVGTYTELRGRKYFKGPHVPDLGDLTDSEAVIFGL
jgi:hypothetical protein